MMVDFEYLKVRCVERGTKLFKVVPRNMTKTSEFKLQGSLYQTLRKCPNDNSQSVMEQINLGEGGLSCAEKFESPSLQVDYYIVQDGGLDDIQTIFKSFQFMIWSNQGLERYYCLTEGIQSVSTLQDQNSQATVMEDWQSLRKPGLMPCNQGESGVAIGRDIKSIN